MSPLRDAVGKGWLVAMPPERHPGNGRHNHTLRHWLSTRGELDGIRPSQALRAKAWTAERCREHVVLTTDALSWKDLDEIPFDSRVVTRTDAWWKEPVRRAVEACHLHGLWPVYLSVVRRSGLPGGSKGWHKQKDARWKLVSEDGVEVHGDWNGEDFLVVSVARPCVLKAPPKPPPPADRAFRDLLRQTGVRR